MRATMSLRAANWCWTRPVLETVNSISRDFPVFNYAFFRLTDQRELIERLRARNLESTRRYELVMAAMNALVGVGYARDSWRVRDLDENSVLIAPFLDTCTKRLRISRVSNRC